MKHFAEHYIMRFPECFVGARVTVGLEVAYDRVAVLCKPCSGGAGTPGFGSFGNGAVGFLLCREDKF